MELELVLELALKMEHVKELMLAWMKECKWDG
jgi:hypothetical protein